MIIFFVASLTLRNLPITTVGSTYLACSLLRVGGGGGGGGGGGTIAYIQDSTDSKT